jgi:hypothetical protein
MIFSGTANFNTLAKALKEKSSRRAKETILAWRFSPGNLFRIPLPKIEPCKIPTLSTTANEIRKFSSAISNRFIGI